MADRRHNHVHEHLHETGPRVLSPYLKHIETESPNDIDSLNAHASTSTNTLMENVGVTPNASDKVSTRATRAWFKASELATIYNVPSPNTANKVVIGVISFGGGLVGSVDSQGVLTGGDVQAYWNYLGIPSGNWPTVVVVGTGGAVNTPNPADGGATAENTLDVQMIGSMCPSPNLIIILYLSPNTLSGFPAVFTYALNTPVTVNGSAVTPHILSVSWGAPETYFTNLATINAVFATAVSRGIAICVATGDNGSSDGLRGGNYVDFPSSSPNVIACGGTTLTCPNYVYDSSTTETTWSGTGGGVSRTFARPAYQANLIGAVSRNTPDIAFVANPSTGVAFIVGGVNVVYGGTSVSAPGIAGYIAAIKSNNMTWNTFFNPQLYASRQQSITGCHDVLIGSNGGFSAKLGYDNCTGWGSINGGTLAPIILADPISPIRVTGITVSPSSATIARRGTYQIPFTIAPSNASNKNITFSSSSRSVSVNSTGLITATSTGSSVITITTTDGGFRVNFTIYVSR